MQVPLCNCGTAPHADPQNNGLCRYRRGEMNTAASAVNPGIPMLAPLPDDGGRGRRTATDLWPHITCPAIPSAANMPVRPSVNGAPRVITHCALSSSVTSDILHNTSVRRIRSARSTSRQERYSLLCSANRRHRVVAADTVFHCCRATLRP